MEIVTPSPSSNGVSPFHNHDVREWSRIDNLTGALERARLETDHWSASTNTSAHKYNKVVDSRARSDADGAVQQHARRQLEVFQSSVPGGRLQVIKTHTVSSSRWSSRSTTQVENKDIGQHFEDLNLSINPLDLSSQKSKAIVGRTIGKRPPSRPHNRDEINSSSSTHNNQIRSLNNTTRNFRVSRLCHQIHDNAVKETFGIYAKPNILAQKTEIPTQIAQPEKAKPTLCRTRSSSSEDINLLTSSNAKSNKSSEDLEDLEQLQNWRRASKVRRSLQFPKQIRPATLTKTIDLPPNTGSVRRIREDLETGRRLSTALRGNNVDLEALDQILQSISNSSGSDKNSVSDKNDEPERDVIVKSHKQKRNSFVTVESLQEVKGRLKHTNSSKSDNYKSVNQIKSDEDIDDGIVTEESVSEPKMPEGNVPKQSRVRSYVYGMETMMNKKAVLGTGSLESRSSKQYGGTGTTRNEDWYNRRKSYGFEQVHNQQESISSINKSKTLVDSSTDSGICRSSEIVVAPTAKNGINYKSYINNERDYNLDYEKNNCDTISHTSGSVKRYTCMFENKAENGAGKQSTNDLIKSYDQDRKSDFGSENLVPVPVIVQNNNFNVSASPSVINSFAASDKYNIKRHSIAVDETKYVKPITDTSFSHTGMTANDSFLQEDIDDYINQNRKLKKVEFCKTEVHFAAESGRVNIVETDEKPPPTNNFRRRRRHSATFQLLDSAENTDLPLIHFGDANYEKLQCDTSEKQSGTPYHVTANGFEKNKLRNNSTVTISTGTHPNYYCNDIEDDQKEVFDSETPKGILKNKPIKPKPYLLGDDNFFSDENVNNTNSEIWGVKLRSITDKQDTPVWRSTVTLKNTLYDKDKEASKSEDVLQMELQKILQNLHHKQTDFETYNKNTEKQNIIRIIHPPVELNKSPSLRSDPVNHRESQKLENRVYSTKVNIGHGDAIVVKENLNRTATRNSLQHKTDSTKDLPHIGIGSKEKVVSSSNYNNLKQQRKSSPNCLTTRSPVILRKNVSIQRQELKSAYNAEKLSSPSLVGQEQSVYSDDTSTHLKHVSLSNLLQHRNVTDTENITNAPAASPRNYRRARDSENTSPSPVRKLSSPKLLHSDLKPEQCPISPTARVLRTPKKSEMTYFGVKITPSPKLERKLHKTELINNKPDLLQITPLKQALINDDKLPIYENVTDAKVQKQFDSSILDELTKAADQILQAVNEYAEEVNMQENMCKTRPIEKLETISETKSWKNSHNKNTNHTNTKNEPKTKRTSSTSSIDSAIDQKKVLLATKNIPDTETRKKKNGSETSSSKAAVKARRLQRASSREALLQSHGSSSEDLPISVPIRKPRLSKKNKSTTSIVRYESETGKTINCDVRKHDERSKMNERIPIGALPEIRHKTAISTIRSTAEKSAMQDRLQKSRNDDARKSSSKKDSSRSNSTSKAEKSRSIANREPINYRISTAKIRNCYKSETSSR